ncbi:DUF637 domain-containing protein [Aeromonas tecta]|uniref:DUF637 domain-containing protein n=1 Tax=Aeromonas tecta TaxID=324617 RepID=UPI000680FCE5|nr:DUF637 domain-containing protein [Aeromonas tecta]
MQPATSDLFSWDTFNRVTSHSAVTAGINTTINGSHFADAFKASLLSNIQGEVGKSTANWIGDQGIKFDAANSALAEAGKIAAHGVTSGAIAEITGGKFAAGAAGGAMSELASSWSSQVFSNTEHQVALNKVLGGLAAVAVTGDQNQFDIGAERAETVYRYNYLSHPQEKEREKDFVSCNGERLCIVQEGAKWNAISLLQDSTFGAGMLAGVPAGMIDGVQGLVQLGLNPVQTLTALKELVNSGDILGTAKDAIKQSYLARIEAAEAEYQKAGASGSFNAGMEYGKLLVEGASLVAGGAGAIKGGALLTEKVTAKLVKEGGETLLPAVGKPVMVTYPDGISFRIDQPKHLATVDGFTQKSGISGGHNANVFYDAAKEYNVKIVSETPTGVNGITEVRYLILTKDRAGNLTGEYKVTPETKTIYDP